jgi:alpha-ketoglutarate-dependent taurine dioxygenase
MLHIERAAPGVGVIAAGVDVNHLSGDEWRLLYQAWLDHNVLVVRGQELTIEQFLDYSRRFGRLKPHRVRRTRHAQYPELTVMGENTRKADGKVDTSVYARGQNWHTDGPWDTEVVKATQLYAVEIPSVGGDTLFANMYTAYEALPPALKQRIEGLEAEFVYGGRTRQGIDLLDPEDQAAPPAVHPIARVHAETGRRSLYVNPIHIQRIVGLSHEEGEALIDELFAYMVQPGAEYRHAWRKGDLVVWDNRSSIHSATGGYPIHERRIHWRVTIMEEPAAEGLTRAA